MSREINEAFNDKCLNIAESAAVCASLSEIKLNENFDNTKFWGKILGINRDYLIAVATKVTHHIERKYFFSQDEGLTFSQLPIVEPWMEPKCLTIGQRFTGTPSYIYPEPKNENKSENEENEENNDEENNDDDDENNEKNNNKGDEPPPIIHKLTELDRLSWTVLKIDDECKIIPKGSIILTSKKIMLKNVNFNGLSPNDSLKIENYLHYRTPRDKYSISKYRKISASNDTDFLDGLSMDVPNGCWILNKYQNGLKIIIKNLLWPGFEFQYNVSTPEYYQAYFGLGIRQNDLIFMM